MAAPMTHSVDLGFVEETEELWRLESHYFPSKVGGRPSWLALSKLPTIDQLTCVDCRKPLIFLIQIYAPLSETTDTSSPAANAFHRTLFVFCCRTPSCGSKNTFKVFRSQLQHRNDFYSEAPPPEKFDPQLPKPNARDYQAICVVCGCSGSKHCGKCKSVNYCSKEHQIVDWKNGHKASCSVVTDADYDKNNPLLFPVLELVMEKEPDENTAEKTDEENMAEYEEYLRSNESSKMFAGKDESDLEKMANAGDEDKKFRLFKKRISRESEQVLRYERGGEPLWVSGVNIPSNDDIPKCQCGAERKFEFQILPQLLHHLGVTTLDECLDWGTLIVYTCSDNCRQEDTNYIQEFAWRQDFAH